ncbi:molybdate transport system substrate-binding protein [Dietzia kunjamensis]|uniref:molybdate ABC transporter substrate-binding protein n=1 Tax=Dietzia kunjamensis TaxID=322509 RepID=UPI000FEF9A2D|nr:molybdate ABC transporter substrate-binding protein [Dietzia kunjamensis]RKE67187.1 molybdate transport system substrate-binding protein [Dietzia kunjamensis]
MPFRIGGGGRRLRAAALVAAVGLSSLVGCASGGDDDEVAQQLTVFAAASLSGAFTEIAEDFEATHPGVSIRLGFDGSSGLVDQLAGGAPADVFASADVRTMDRAVAEGLVAGEPTPLATNVLTLITPPGNPAGITGLDDSLDGARLVVCAAVVPCGAAARTLADAAGIDLAPVSEESTVTDVRGKVTSGEADAGIVYATDARAVADRVERVPIAGADAVPNVYPVAVLERAADADLARRFVDAVTGPEGRAILAEHGFGPP